MAKLKSTDQLKLEKLFEMGGGYVLDFANATFQHFIRNNTGLDIYLPKYETYGESKAKRLRAFWELESDHTVGRIISEMIDHWRTLKMLNDTEISKSEEMLSKDCQGIADRLLGKTQVEAETKNGDKTEVDFLQHNFGKVSLGGLVDVLDQRIIEIQKNLKSGASLSVIFLCGSTLEGILLGVATRYPKKFNQATASPKDSESGKVLNFHKWSLHDMINVAHEVGLLGLDVKKFSHVLRGFRNDIHPYEQWSSGFNPDGHTALISWQVLQAAIHDLSKIGMH